MSTVSNADINDLIEAMTDIAESPFGEVVPRDHIKFVMARAAFIVGILAGERYAVQREMEK